MSSRSVRFAEEALGGGARSVRFAEEALGGGGGSSSLVMGAASSDVDKNRAQQQQQQPAVLSMICINCGSREIEQHDASGASVCTDCGVVVEENAIVSSIEFVEGAGGASSMVGQFVSATSSKAYTGSGGAGRGGRYGFSRASRETTLANGRRRIQDVASRLRLGSHYVDAAHRLFTIAVEKNFVQGRRTTHVVAACLYIACRQEKSQHMLIDFSDALQVNVYVLGTCFLKFRRLLGLKLEIIDPALFVYRFAAHLDLDEKANAVALTALRLVGRMKRDWIVAGRRPAGICAAALLIAARAHGFSRHHQDVTKILRVCGMTVTSRVKEFENTPSAMLTLDQFNTVELDSETDPPVFTRNKFREARAKAIQENNVELLTSGKLDDPREGKKSAGWRRQKLNAKKAEFKQLYQSLEKELVETTNKDKNGTSSSTGTTTQEESSTEKDSETTSTQIVLRPEGELSVPSEQLAHMYPKSKYGRALLLPRQATAEELQKSTQPTEEKINFTAWKKEMPEDDANDIESLFRSEEEIVQKEAIFNKMNTDYLAQQERKESERLRAEAASKDQEKDDAAQAEGHARYTIKTGRGRKRRRDSVEGESEGEPTTEEALYAAVSSRKISRKINYDAMSAIFDSEGAFDTNILDDEQDDSPTELEDIDPVLTMV